MASTLTVGGLTTTRIPVASTGGLLVDYSNFTRNSDDTITIGTARTGNWSVNVANAFWQSSSLSVAAGNYGLIQANDGTLTVINSPNGTVGMRLNNANIFTSTTSLASLASGVQLSVANTTDSTSPTTGSVSTLGGMSFGVTKSLFGGGIKSTSATLGIGYATGAGGTVTQITSRTTGVTLNTICGAVTLVSAAGSATYQSLTVTNSTVAISDTIILNQRSGTDLYLLSVTSVTAGTFRITYATTGGTTVEQPVFNFLIIKSVAA
jgi:hypothetical protein